MFEYRWPGWDSKAQDVAKPKTWPDHAPGQRLQLTKAIRLESPADYPPREGYRVEIYRDLDLDIRMPVLTAAISADKVFPLFIDLMPPLGNEVDLIIESSHDLLPEREGESPVPVTWEREAIDLPVLTSILYDFEEMLVNDGCTGVAVLNQTRQLEVHFDEHKLLYMYGPSISVFEKILKSHGIKRDDDLILLTESEHVHCTLDEYFEQLNDFRQLVGVEDEVESTSW